MSVVHLAHATRNNIRVGRDAASDVQAARYGGGRVAAAGTLNGNT